MTKEELLLAEACQALEACFRSLGSEPADIADMLSPELLEWWRDHKADAPVRSYELSDAERKQAIDAAVAFALKAVVREEQT